MPIFPFHTWQPDLYEQSNSSTTMVLSGVMVKMGVFACMRWLLPVVSVASFQWGDVVTSLAVTGILYASLVAIQQDDLKRLVAYSSIAHIGLMCATIFSETTIGFQGVMIQMFNHGINIIGLWIVVDVIEKQCGTRKISELGGLAQRAPSLAIFAMIIALANIALPLTNAFIGEFMMFNGIFSSKITHYNVVFTVLAAISIILAAIYILNMIRKVFYGISNAVTTAAQDITWNQKLVLSVIVILIIWLGVYPDSILNLTHDVTDTILKKSDVLPLLMKH
jgi:NADH-quinone oxidoreductase subunit M